MRKLFGTDGIRGKANVYPMTGEVAMALGRAVTQYFFKSQNRTNNRKAPLIVIGKDTRLSCYMLEQAFASGVCSQGGRAILTGPLTTPGVAFVAQSMRADAGIMISASHNPYFDNGIKIFDGNGFKLPDEVELELERLILNPELLEVKLHEDLGRAKRLDQVMGRYIVRAKQAFSLRSSLEGLRIVLDCANGAGYKVAPLIFEELGAEVINIGVNPNGTNINKGCGALYPEQCARAVVDYRADFGICLDGDGDRLIVVDEKGKIIDGDQLLGTLAKYLDHMNQLGASKTVIGTVMSNAGLENYLTRNGMNFHRTQVGDRYIIKKMLSSDAVFGGEPSGHLIFKNHSTTGDGILAALKVIECSLFFQKSIGELASEVDLYPQILNNVKVKEKVPFENLPNLTKVVKESESKLKGKGRILLRYSGTEDLARIMVEGENDTEIKRISIDLEEALLSDI